MADYTTTNESGVVAQTQENPDFPVYLIHSNWSLPQLDTFLSDYGDVGFLRIVYDKDRKETDRTMAILSVATFNALCEDGYDQRQYGRGLKVSKFTLNNWCYPSAGNSKVLFVRVPKCFAQDDAQVIAGVTGKLEHLAEWGIIPTDSWSVKVPLKSRETGGVRNGCFISFKRDVHLDRIAMTRLLLTDTYWPDDDENGNRLLFQCTWARDRGEVKVKKIQEKVPPGTVGLTQSTTEEEKHKKAIQKFAKKAKPAPRLADKAVTVPIPVDDEPSLKTQEVE
jgi:hypothetical protein